MSKVPLTVRRPPVEIADAAETFPVIVSTPKSLVGLRILTVAPAPLIVTVLEVPVKVEPAPEVSQFPDTVQEPEAVIVPEAPPVIVTLTTDTVDVPAVSVAPLPTVRLPPVSARFAVARVALLLRVRVPPQRSRFVAMVNVAAAVGLNCTLLNSATGRLPNVMVLDAPALKTIVPVPAFQEAEVEESVQDPPIVQVSEPKTM